jgi:hypothetical protein
VGREGEDTTSLALSRSNKAKSNRRTKTGKSIGRFTLVGACADIMRTDVADEKGFSQRSDNCKFAADLNGGRTLFPKNEWDSSGLVGPLDVLRS